MIKNIRKLFSTYNNLEELYFSSKRVIYIIKPLLITILFLLALSFENASSNRTLILTGIFTSLTLWGFIRPIIQNRFPWIFFIDTGLIFLLEYYSKYLINYFFHFIYIAVILEVCIAVLNKKSSNIIAILTSVVAIRKFAYAFYLMPNAKTTAEFFFNFLALAFLIIIINYGRLQAEGRHENEILYKELLKAYDKLKEYSNIREESLALKERGRIAGELHDSVGHSLTALLMQIEMVDHLYKKGEDIREHLQETKISARQALTGTREAVAALKELPQRSIEDIKDMINQFSKDTNVDVVYNLPSMYLLPEEGIVLYRIFQEALTNALRHGKCTKIDINTEIKEGIFHFYIEDNGAGSEGKDGFGQNNMKERIKSIGGKLKIITGKPYKIIGSFPLRRDAK